MKKKIGAANDVACEKMHFHTKICKTIWQKIKTTAKPTLNLQTSKYIKIKHALTLPALKKWHAMQCDRV